MDPELKRRINEEIVEFRRSLRTLDAERKADYLRAEETRTSRPLYEVRQTEVFPDAFGKGKPGERSFDNFSSTPPHDQNPPPLPKPPTTPPESGFADVGIHSFELTISYSDNPAPDNDSSNTAWNQAVTNAQTGETTENEYAFDGMSQDVQLSFGTITRNQAQQPDGSYWYNWSVQIRRFDWAWLVATSTGYLKIYWDEVGVLTHSETGGFSSGEVSRIAKTYEYTGDPVGDLGDASTYDDGPQYACPYDEIRPPDPTTSHANTMSFYVDNVRWSAVEGYVPPEDGSGNGFPPS